MTEQRAGSVQDAEVSDQVRRQPRPLLPKGGQPFRESLEHCYRFGRLALDALGGALRPFGSALLRRRRDALGGDAHGLRRRLLGRPKVGADVQVPHYHSTLSILARHRPGGLTAPPSATAGSKPQP